MAKKRSSPHAPGSRGSGRRNEAVVGMAIVIGVLLLFFGVRYLEDRPLFTSTYTLEAEFDDADGLMPGSAVTVNGVKVGEVKRVRLMPGMQRVHVEMEVRGRYEIPRGAVARIRGIAALDDVRVDITPGPPDAPPLADGDTIGGSSEPQLVDRADSTLAGVDRTFDQARSLLAGTEADLNIVLANMRTASGEAATLIQGERGRIHDAVTNLQAAMAQLSPVVTQLDRVATEGGDTLVVAVNQFNEVMARLDVVARSLERSGVEVELMMAGINGGSGTLGRLVYDPTLYLRLDSAAVSLDSAAHRLDDILADFKENPGRYLGQMKLIDIF